MDNEEIKKVFLSAVRVVLVPQDWGSDDLIRREYLDLSKVYCVMDGEKGIFLKKKILKNGLFTEDELDDAAMWNTKDTIVWEPIYKKIMRLAGQMDSFVSEEADSKDLAVMEDLYVFTSEDIMFGGAALLYPERFFELASEVDSDLILIPSSIHEIIAVPASSRLSADINEMIREVNAEEVEENEQLSDHAYYYDYQQTGAIRIIVFVEGAPA